MSHKSFKFHFYIVFIVIIVLQPLLKKIQRTSESVDAILALMLFAVSRTATKFQ